MADQNYDKDSNRFWIDLHKCSRVDADQNISSVIEECYRYGITEIEIIYGTPDRYEGSIQEMIEETVGSNPLVENMSRIHAGCIFTLSENPNPEPRDEDMHFSAISATHDNWHKVMSYDREYYPFRTVYSADEVSYKMGCSIEYIRKVADKLPFNCAEKITEYNQITRRNEKSWQIYSKGLDALNEKWKSDKEIIESELRIKGAKSDEIESILLMIRTPIEPGKSIKARISGALSKLRKQRELKK